jgi:hypothetical protein
MSTRPETLCPSAQPDWEGARVIGVVGGTPERPETAYLDQAQPVTQEILELAGPVAPAEVFRFAAPCANSACGHYDGAEHKCRLAEKTVRWVAQAVDNLPKCSIRASCRWWQQEGPAACRRCPQVVTINFAPSKAMRDAADPQLT